MSVQYKAIGWNRQKRIYDAWLAAGVALYVAIFAGAGWLSHPDATVETLLIRALGTGAFVLLHVVLSVGPLCRLDLRFLPLLYNRRHMGVTVFLLALAHGIFSVVQFHAGGDRNPFVSLLTANPRLLSLGQFPFELLGLSALGILFLMAATSHDFWLANLTAPIWKSLHMLVYVAYALLVLHVTLGSLQDDRGLVRSALLAAGMAWVFGLHLVAGLRERGADRDAAAPEAGGFVDVCAVADIPECRARVVCLSGERVAVFRYGGKVSALSNACQHQNGPLGEGRVIDGCVTCPWHGYQYLPDSGASPPPFTERVPTFRVRVAGGRVLVDPRPNPPGTRVEPAVVGAPAGGGAHA